VGLANLGMLLNLLLFLLKLFQHFQGWCIFQFYLLQLLDHGKDTENKQKTWIQGKCRKNIHHILRKVESITAGLLADP
jgi:hypothetical protein